MMYPESNDGPRLSSTPQVDVSIVIPMRNEEENVLAVCAELVAFMDDQRERYEVVIVNDGSEDATGQLLERCSSGDGRFTVIEFARRFGQAAAMDAGFQSARGKVIVPMDGDLQNDPADIPGLVAQLDEGEGSDIVSGWRRDRKDRWLSRRLPSIVANRLIRKLTWCDELNDFGCTLKAYRREALEGIRLYGEMHRFLPALCRWRGARLSERVVNHRPRVAGESKYGIIRTFKVLLDLMTVKFLGDYLQKPMYFFAKLSFVTILMASVAVGFALVQKFGYMTEHGLPVMLNDSIFILFAMMMFLSSIMLILVGIVAELMTRIYFESQGRPPYRVRRTWMGNEKKREPKNESQ